MRRLRGQSLVETTLAMLVVVPILLGLLTFAELGYANLKVKEAGYAALWDLPAHQTHALEPGAAVGPPSEQWRVLQSRNTLATRAGVFAQRYQSLRGPTGEAGNPNVMLKVDGVQVRCLEDAALRPGFAASASDLHALKTLYGPAGSVAQCAVSAEVRIAGLPDFKVSIFGEPILQSRALTLCSFGRRKNGVCPLGPAVLTDSWAFTGAQENASCRVTQCDNPAVRNLALAALDGLAPFPSSNNAIAMATALNLVVPYPQPNASFAGSEDNFLDGAALAHGDATWAPTPFSTAWHQPSYLLRKKGYPAIDLRNQAAGLSP